MRFFQAALVGVTALFSLVSAQSSTLQFTSAPSNVQVGQSYTITWKAASNAPVTILLRKGSSSDLKTVGTLTTSGAGGTFTWVPERALAPGSDYALQITQGSDSNYYGPFSIAGGNTALSTYGNTATTMTGSTTMTSVGSTVTSMSSLNSTTTAAKNGTITSATLTATSSSGSKGSPTGSGAASGTSTGAPSNAAVPLANPVGLMLGAMAAFAYFQ